MGKIEAELGRFIVHRRWWIILASIAFVIVAASGIRFLTFNTDTRVFFSKENPQLIALEAMENTYTKNQNVFFVFSPENKNVFTRKTLAMLEDFTEEAWKVPYSIKVSSITNFQHTWADGDEMIVEDLVIDAESLSDEDILRKKKIAIAEPLLLDLYVSPSGHVTLVNVNLLMPGKSIKEINEVAEYAKKMANGYMQKHPGLEIYISGSVMIDIGFGEAGKNDVSTLVPAMFVTLLIIIGIALRSVMATMTTLIIIVASMTTALGLAGWYGIVLSVGSVNSATIIMTLAVADSVHILVTMLNNMQQGKSRFEAIEESVRVNLQPVFLTSLTTAIGFLSMNFSDAPPFRDLGNIVATGVMAAFFYSVLLLPAIMAVIPLETKARDNDYCPQCNWVADIVIRRQKTFFWGILALIFLLTAGILNIELNDDFMKYFGKRYDIRVANDFLEDNLTGINIIEYSLETPETGGIHDPAYLSKVEAFANWYRSQPKVVHVTAISDTMKRLNKNMHGDDEAFYLIPEKRELAAQYLLLYEMSLPFGLDMNDRINVDKSAARLTVAVVRATSREIRELDENARAWLKENAPESMFAYGTGLSVVWAHISQRNINSMLGASFMALILISATLIVALRSLKLGVVSLVPNLVPALMALGIWGMAVSKVGLTVSVLAAMTMGIVVDDTVHFISKYLRARREHNLSPEEAVRYSFNMVGTALWVTTAALVAGFMVLAFSGFRINSDMGIITAITITLALGLDFFFLPTLLMKVDK